MEAEGMWSDLMGEEITMRTLENAIIAMILILFGQPVYAGVIMSETEMQSGIR
jgi:hypothetical protein